jgi:transcriptional regulator with XRE-family HTH domain
LVSLRRRVGHRIRELRSLAELTRVELGELVNLDAEAIGRIERGERMKFDNLEPFADALGVRVVDLFECGAPPVGGTPFASDVTRVALFVARRAKSDPSFPRRVLKILREI